MGNATGLESWDCFWFEIPERKGHKGCFGAKDFAQAFLDFDKSWVILGQAIRTSVSSGCLLVFVQSPY